MTSWRHERRKIGATQVEISRLGLGTAPLGNLFEAVSDSQACETIKAANDAQIQYFDTAPHYGFGLSERRLGQTVSHRATVSTKVGRRLEATSASTTALGFVDADPFISVFDYSYKATQTTLADSLVRLCRQHIDIVYVHDLGHLTHGAQHADRLVQALDGAFTCLLELKAQGIVGAIGLGVNEYEIADEVIAHTPIDVVLLAGRHTLLDQSAHAAGFLARCFEANIALILGGVFNSGLLADPFAIGAQFDYAPAPSHQIERAQAMAQACARYNVPLGAAALQFSRSQPAVTGVIAGARSAAQVQEIVEWADIAIPPRLWDELRQL